VDARHIHLHLHDSPEAQKQVAFADVILLNKTDLVPMEYLDQLEPRIRSINAVAKIHRTTNASLPIEKVLNVGGFNLERAVDVDPQFLEMEYPFEWAGAYELPAGDYELEIGHAHGEGHDHHHHHHDAPSDLSAIGPATAEALAKEGHECGPDCGHNHNELDVVVMPLKSLDEKDLASCINATVLLYSDWEKIVQPGETITAGAQLHRLKLKDEHGKFKVTLPAAGRYLLFTGHDVPTHLRSNGQVVRYGWDKTFRHEHSHDEAVSSVGISVPGELDGKKLNAWISELLKDKGGDIFRMKGVLVVKGTKKRLVFQGVHMLFDAKFDREWKDGENRTNTLVFIGKNLDRAALTEGFKSCLA
jgi:G3E family GTPase